ncbi:hypothetical protein EYC84_009519 [Monilinia fructicola]|uniref:Uncharacterized protein n=1 Tax=Monilinia fructicola TaxID=38448 RepID=A0A5M9J7U2_MONFR|nr:hypothetical protein EYC84_009519 [Monilinia fructicola]
MIGDGEYHRPTQMRQRRCEKPLRLELLSMIRTHSTPLIHTNSPQAKGQPGTSHFTQHPFPVAHQRKNPHQQ